MPPSPPTGTVTFLFTDIEGSTRLWEAYPDAMRPALARHDDLLRQSIEGEDGYVFKTVGDAFCASFPTANQALEAALTAQIALAAEVWEMPTPLLVRMALHTGSAEERGGDYFGPPLNRVARLMAAGHGGQVLISGATQELTRDHLPPNTSLVDLGQRRLKDLGRPEQVYQVDHPALAADFPPLRSLDNPDLPNNLPQQVTSFIGREKEIAEIKTLLAKTRLLTLAGSGGAGKTRLSLQVAADLLDQYFDGVWLVELAALSDAALVSQAVADTLGVREEAGKTIPQTLTDWLKPRRLLLILDNCEHVVAACAALATDLLQSCPDIHLLASSREPLNIAGEQTYRVPSLSLPDPKQAQTVETVSQFEAVRLFIERAQAVLPTFGVTDTNAPAVAQVCWRLDGIPLAIELAAARVRSLPVTEISTRLDNRFRLLTGGSRTLLPRQQTLRALIDWSYDLLTESEKTLLCRLSVFAGGWTLSAAEGICVSEDLEESEVLDLLTSLVDKSLVVYEEEGASDGDRYRFLETVRQYAVDRLREHGKAETWQERSALWFLALAEGAEPKLLGPEQASWLEQLEVEHDNLRASLTWFEQSGAGVEAGQRFVGALYRFWSVRGHYSEGRQWSGRALERIQERTENVGTLARAKALKGAASLARGQGDYTAARTLFEESLVIERRLGNEQSVAGLLDKLGSVASDQGDFAAAQVLCAESLTIQRRLGDQQGIAGSLDTLGNVAAQQGDFAAARTMYVESLAAFRQLGDQRSVAGSLINLGIVAAEQGDFVGAQALFEESLFVFRELGDQTGIASLLGNLGSIAAQQGDFTAAQALHEENLTIERQLGNQQGVANSLGNLGYTIYARGDHTGAQALFEEGLTIFRQLGDQRGIAESLEGLARLASDQDQPSRATHLYGAAASLRQNIGSPLNFAEQEEWDKIMASANETLGEDAFSAAWNAGQAMTREQAIEYALGQE